MTTRRNKTSDTINRRYIKTLALRISHQTGRPFKRIGKDFLDEFAKETGESLAAKIRRHPSIGQTLKASFPND